jgi:hypothetical protein
VKDLITRLRESRWIHGKMIIKGTFAKNSYCRMRM